MLFAVTGADDVEPKLGMCRVMGLEKGVWCVKMRLNGIKLCYLRNPMPISLLTLAIGSLFVAFSSAGSNFDANA